jgi:hypothetical protein
VSLYYADPPVCSYGDCQSDADANYNLLHTHFSARLSSDCLSSAPAVLQLDGLKSDPPYTVTLALYFTLLARLKAYTSNRRNAGVTNGSLLD